MSRLSLIHQAGALKSYFPDSEINRKGEIELNWIATLTPSPLSDSYTLRLHYRFNEGVKIYVVAPKPLKLSKGKNVLPHVYSTPEQQLCLYYPKYKEWNTSMYYVRTLIPWACEWLCHYELWVSTGTWHGGGIHHETEAEKMTNNEKEEMNEPKRINK